MQASNITTNIKFEVEFTLPELSLSNVATWKCHVDDRSKGRYNIMLWIDLLTWLVLNLKLSDNVIKADDGPLKGSISPMVGLGMY